MLVITCFHFYRLPLWQNVPICATSAPFLIVSLHANSSGLEVSSKHVHWPLKFWAWCVFSSSLIYYMLLQVHTAHKNNTLHTRIIESWTVCIHFQWNRFEWLPVGLLGRTHETPCKCWPANLHRRSSHWSALVARIGAPAHWFQHCRLVFWPSKWQLTLLTLGRSECGCGGYASDTKQLWPHDRCS